MDIKNKVTYRIRVAVCETDNGTPEIWSGFPPKEIAPEVDFLAVHVYPERGKVNIALDSLRRYQVGKPVLIEETFPMKCPKKEWRVFLEASRGLAQGWLGQYWSLSPQDIAGSSDRVHGLLRRQYEIFQELSPSR